ncbi:MAG: Adenylate cyclase [Myxococcales bacterium]|nr:Adenylate cyclase [Myxococcales bacterium]
MKKSILVIEGSDDLRTGLVILLRLVGYDAIGESTPSAGLQRLLERDFDLVITDWMIGRLTAESMLVQADTAGALEGVGVLIHTGWPYIDRPASLARAVIVTKSPRSEILMETIARMLPGTLHPEFARRLFTASSAPEPTRNLPERQAEQDRPAVWSSVGVRNRIQAAK